MMRLIRIICRDAGTAMVKVSILQLDDIGFGVEPHPIRVDVYGR